MIDLRHTTIFLIAALFLIGGGGDILLGLFGGNRATISRVWLDLTGRHPELFFEMAYTLTLFFLHLCFAKMSPAPAMIVRIPLILLALAPIFRMLWVITLSRPGDDEAYEVLVNRSGTKMALLSLAGVVAAWPAYWYAVPQHVTQ